MPKTPTTDHTSRERALRMLALQIVGQLPAESGEAERVLQYALKLLKEFLHEDKPPPQRSHLRSVS